MKLNQGLVPAIMLVYCLSVAAQQPVIRTEPAGEQELAAMTVRGQAFTAYDAAAWHATDAVMAMHPPKDAVQMYIGRKSATGWEVAFGKLNDARDVFLISYDAEPTGDVLHPKIRETSAYNRPGRLAVHRASL